MINAWLNAFKAAWIAKDIDQVLSLFADDVEYWETPHKKLDGKAALSHEWNAILGQKDIALELRVFSSSDGNAHSVLWELSYEDEKSRIQNWAGTYLIELNAAGKCVYFHQTGEKK